MWAKIEKLLFTQIDNTGLVLFRIAFGLLITIEAWGAIATGWVARTLAEPEFTFNFIGFEFLQPLVGPWMFYYFALMGFFGLLVMLGFKYRWSMLGYAIMWTCVYLLQKSSYNNHYYLLMLLCYIMVLLPAHRGLSLDVAINPKIATTAMPRWCRLIVILQILIVFTYAAVAKIYPDWLDTTVPRLFMRGKADYWLIGDFLQLPWVHYCIAYFGILFDLLIIPLFLNKKTRLLAFGMSLFFHLFNSVVFQIGIFPYMSIAFALFFFSSPTLVKRFRLKRPIYSAGAIKAPKMAKVFVAFGIVYFIIQMALPLRHWAIPDDVLWTEEGHRLSWRMMLRTKSGRVIYYVKDKNDSTATKKNYGYRNMLTKKQYRAFRSKPDMIWQLAQRIKAKEAAAGRDVAVYVSAKLKVNAGTYQPFIEPEIDLGSTPWEHFKHNDWIEPSVVDFSKAKEKKKTDNPTEIN
ncbi:MAG: HTTM domain-containing protein [Gilvibacter sp.]